MLFAAAALCAHGTLVSAHLSNENVPQVAVRNPHMD